MLIANVEGWTLSDFSKSALTLRLRQLTSGLSISERRVARVLLATNLRAAKGTVATLASEAGVSGPTVLRFVAKIGFDGFAAFQEAAELEFSQRISSPAMQLDQPMKGMEAAAFLAEARKQMIAGVEATFDAINLREFEKACELLRNPRRDIYVLGGQLSQIFAEYLTRRLYQVRSDVRSAGATSLVISKEEELLSLTKSSVVVAFDFRRYQASTIELARGATARGATLIAVTDTWISPMADFASIVLPIHLEAPWGHDSFANAGVLVEVLFGRILSESDDDALQRIKLLDAQQKGLLN